jgi:DNA-binding SARP family transcriptional activator
MPGSSVLTLRLLGTPHIEHAGRTLALTSQKAQALLVYLAATGQSHTRDYLTALLWGDAMLSDARHSLRSTLHKLRQVLRTAELEDLLQVSNDTLHLDMQRIDCDLLHFYALTSTGTEADLAAAVRLVRGPLLQGFSLPDATLFDEFIRLEDARVGRMQRTALEHLTTFAEQREEWECATHYAEQLVQLDPLDEPAQQRLLHLYVRAGSPRLAQRQYAHFERLLRDELGIEPAAATRDILRIATTQRRTDPPPLAPLPALEAALPFVGRQPRLAQIQQLAQQVAQGHGITLLVEGDAGIGKSRLIAELFHALPPPLGRQRWQILHGRASPFDAILTYGAFREALQQHFPTAPEPPIASQIQHLLATMAQQGPVVLVLDDLHHADTPTLELFGYLAYHVRHLPLLLIGTVQRVDDLLTLRQLATLGRRQGTVEMIRLEPLDQAAITSMLRALGVVAGAAETLAPWIAERSDGNPFVVEALITQLRTEGLFVRTEHGLHVDAQRWLQWRTSTTLPASTYDLVSLRLSLLEPTARQVINLLALAVDGLTPTVLAHALDLSIVTVQVAAEALIRLRLVDERADLLALPHQLLREAVLAQLSTLSQRMLNQQLALALEQCATPDPATQAQIARHAVAAGDIVRARRVGLPLLRELPHTLIGAEAITFLKRLADLLEPTATPDELHLLTHALGQRFRLIGQIDSAHDWHQRQLALAQQAGLPGAEALAQFDLADLALVSNHYAAAATAARAGLRRALHATPAERPGLQGRGHCLLGAALAMEGSDLPGAEEQLQRAIEAHRRAEDRDNLSSTLFELGNVVAQQGVIGRAVELYAEAAKVATEAQAPFLLALAQNNYAYHSLLLGQPAQARTALQHGRAVAEQHALNSVLLHLLSTESEIQLYSGEWDAAEAACRHGLALAQAFQNLERQAGYQAGLALVAAGRGQPREAISQLEAALHLISGHTFWHLRTRLLLWLVEQTIVLDPPAADRYLDTALGLARTQQRQLLLIQAERLQALRLAQTQPALAQAQLLALLERCTSYELPVEIARTRAALGQVILAQTPGSETGRALRDDASRQLERYGAYAELRTLVVP